MIQKRRGFWRPISQAQGEMQQLLQDNKKSQLNLETYFG
jgi:hypothetical protein